MSAKEHQLSSRISAMPFEELKSYLFSTEYPNIDYKISCKILLEKLTTQNKKSENLERMILNEREKRLENESLAKEFLNMKKINEELISKCKVLENEIGIHRAISHKKSKKGRNRAQGARNENGIGGSSAVHLTPKTNLTNFSGSDLRL